MPVDLSPAGRPSAYPRRPRFWPWWFFIWLACNVFGVAIATLLWPKGQTASGAWFWFCVVCFPDGVFVILFAIERAGYEGLWFRAHWRNHHRSRWLAGRLRIAQKPLQVLGVGYSLPLGEQTLADAIGAAKRLPRAQIPRIGSDLVVHTRFDEANWTVEEPVISDPDSREKPVEAESASKQISLLSLKLAQAFEPLVASLRALTRYERVWWPQIRVLSEQGREQADVAQIVEALRIAGLPPLAVQATLASDGLMLADTWLDANDARPLLVVGTAWHEAGPPEGSAEGCVAVLLATGHFQLPDTVNVAARLHRPVAALATEVEYGFANAAVWGNADCASIVRAWITRPVEGCDRALRAARMNAVAKDEAQLRPDRIVGDFGHGNGWLSIAAAVESGAADGPQLVVDGLQSALLHITPETTDINRNTDDRSQAYSELA